MILDFKGDIQKLNTIINDLETALSADLQIDQVGLLKRAVYALCALEQCVAIASEPVTVLPYEEFAERICKSLNDFLRESELAVCEEECFPVQKTRQNGQKDYFLIKDAKQCAHFMEIEKQCVERNALGQCDRNCSSCDLVQNTDDLIWAYRYALWALDTLQEVDKCLHE